MPFSLGIDFGTRIGDATTDANHPKPSSNQESQILGAIEYERTIFKI